MQKLYRVSVVIAENNLHEMLVKFGTMKVFNLEVAAIVNQEGATGPYPNRRPVGRPPKGGTSRPLLAGIFGDRDSVTKVELKAELMKAGHTEKTGAGLIANAVRHKLISKDGNMYTKGERLYV